MQKTTIKPMTTTSIRLPENVVDTLYKLQKCYDNEFKTPITSLNQIIAIAIMHLADTKQLLPKD